MFHCLFYGKAKIYQGDKKNKMKIFNTEIWDNVKRLRVSLYNTAKTLLTFSIVNIFASISTKSWIILAINILGGISAIIIIGGKLKYDSLPPK
jgi:hypothetical protein